MGNVPEKVQESGRLVYRFFSVETDLRGRNGSHYRTGREDVAEGGWG